MDANQFSESSANLHGLKSHHHHQVQVNCGQTQRMVCLSMMSQNQQQNETYSILG